MKKINPQLKRGLFLLVSFLYSTYAYSQSGTGAESNDASKYVPKIFPSSTEAFKFSNYGNIPIGLFTGAPNISIPLVNFEAGTMKVPISLNYSSNGIHIDELNGSTGLGWTLISAGVITRTVRGMPDERNQSLKTVPDIDILGLWTPDVVNYLNDLQYGTIDSDPDIYTANFGGKNLKFVYNTAGKPVIYSQNDYLIEHNYQTNTFTITDDTGVKYYFTEKESVMNRSQGGDHTPPEGHDSAWYLSKMVDITGREINIQYYDSGYMTTLSQSQSLIYTPPGVIQQEFVDSPGDGFPCQLKPYLVSASGGMGLPISSNQTVSGKQIKRIYSRDSNNEIDNEINFTYNPSTNTDFNSLREVIQTYKGNVIKNYLFNYDLTTNGRMFLKDIIDRKTLSKHSFEYLNKGDLPSRLSYSRDIWGLYNAQYNTTLIPQIFDQDAPNTVKYNGANQEFNENTGYYGLLNKINYPTGGSTEILYESHKKNEMQAIPGAKEYVYLNVMTNNEKSDDSKTITIVPKKDEFIKLYAGASFNSDCSEDTDHSRGYLTIRSADGDIIRIFTYSTSTNSYTEAEGTQNGNMMIYPNYAYTDFYIKLKKDVPVTFTLKAMRECTVSSINFSYTKEPDTEQEIQKPFGGFRIKKTIDIPIDGNPIIRNYSYLGNDNKSSVYVTRKPYFLEPQTTRSYCSKDFKWNDLNYFSLTSTNINQLISFNPNIFYGRVTEEIEGKGKIVHHFNTDQDYYGKVLIGKDIASAPWTNFGWGNGNEIQTEYFDNSNKKLKNIVYNFAEDKSRESYVNGISFRKNFDLKVQNDVTLTCTKDNINSTYTQYYCLANHTHSWYTWSDTCHARGHIDKWVTFYSYCYGHPIGDIVITPNVLENMDIMSYKSISRFTYLQSKKTTDYLNGIPVKNETQFFYNNPNHHQSTSQLTTLSDNSISETSYQYAHEKGNQYLIDKNMIGIPLQTSVTQKQNDNDPGKTISKSEILYPVSQADANARTSGLALPVSVLGFDLQNPEDAAKAQTEITYDLYDNKGNILQYSVKGKPVTVIWGYNQTQPIAKIEGAAYNQVSAYVSAIIAASDADNTQGTDQSEQALIGALDILRNNTALSTYQVTTYTYNPLIGVTSITPPSGVREIYKYDSANRLESVKDVNGNLLKEYQYRYKN